MSDIAKQKREECLQIIENMKEPLNIENMKGPLDIENRFENRDIRWYYFEIDTKAPMTLDLKSRIRRVDLKVSAFDLLNLSYELYHELKNAKEELSNAVNELERVNWGLRR